MVKHSVLIVEDEQVVAMDLSLTLKRLGYMVSGVAYTGAEAIEQALQRRPSIMLIDICLKGELDGIDAAAIIRSSTEMPIIYLTAYADEATLARARATVPYGYLVKPFDEHSLRTTIEMALERVAVSRALRDSEERLARILSSIGDAVIATDASGRITMLNPTALALLGCVDQEPIGRSIVELMELFDPVSDRPMPHPAMEALSLRQKVTLPEGTLLHTADGAETWVEGSASLIPGFGDHMSGTVMVLRDITARRQAEEDRLVRLHQEAELKFHERLQLLAGGVAHDLGNVLTVVQGNIDLLRMELAEQPVAVEPFDRIATAVQRAVDLSKQLLAYARRTRLIISSIEILPVVQETLYLLRPLLGSAIKVNLLIPASLPPIAADPVQLRQVLMNLLLNAAEAIGNRPGTITITAADTAVCAGAVGGPARTSESERYVTIAVADSGPGMDAATMQHIFEPFFTTKRHGRGLGLAMTLGILEEHGGTVSVESAIGSGTVFTLSLPAVPTARLAEGGVR